MRRRVKADLVKPRSLPAIQGVADPVVDRLLRKFKEFMLGLQADFNPKDNRDVKAFQGTGGGLSKEAILKLIEDAIEAALDELKSVSRFGGAGRSNVLGRYSVKKDGIYFQFLNDEDTPGNDKVYGTDGAGIKDGKMGYRTRRVSQRAKEFTLMAQALGQLTG